MDSWKEVDKIAFEIPWLEIMYDGLSKETKATITFLHMQPIEILVGAKRRLQMGSRESRKLEQPLG
jgi:hypothetical protein